MTTRTFVARNSGLDAIREFIETTCAPMSHDDQRRVLLLVEELFVNSMLHGYGGECDMPVWLTLELVQGACSVVYEDRAPPYDPFSAPDHSRVDATLDDRPIGGLGIMLITQISSRHSYARRGDRNVIEFEVPATPGTSAAP